MKIFSLNVSEPKEYSIDGKPVVTSLLKEPVDRKLKIKAGILEGNKQFNLEHHGGYDKAIYGYPKEHYKLWAKSFPNIDFVTGIFGENLTTEGILEKDIYIGDIYQIGTCKLQVTQPRQPCSTFGIILRDNSVIKHMVNTGMCGFYFRVVENGELKFGDNINLIDRNDIYLSVENVNKYFYNKQRFKEEIKSVINVEALSESWKNEFKKFLEK